MISSISYGNIKQLSKNNINVLRLLFLISCIVTIPIFLRDNSALAYTSIYVFSGPIGIDWGKWLSLKDEEVADNR